MNDHNDWPHEPSDASWGGALACLGAFILIVAINVAFSYLWEFLAQ